MAAQAASVSASASASASMLCARGTPAAAVHGATREYSPASSCAASIRDLDFAACDTSSRMTPRSGDDNGNGNGNDFFLVARGRQQLRRSSFLPILPSALSAGTWSRGLAVPLWGPGATWRIAGKKRRALRFRAAAGSSQAGPPMKEKRGLPFGLERLYRSKKESSGESQRDDGLVFVAGATGRVGVRLVRVLLKLGFRVRAGVRSKDKALPLLQAARTYNLITPDEERLLEIVEFDLDNVETLPLAIGNAGKVVCTVGASETGGITAPYQVDYIGTKNIIDAAAKLKVGQFVLVSSLGTGKFGLPAGILNLFWGILIWKAQAEKALRESGMSWVIVRPGGMERPKDDYKRTHNLRLAPADTLFGGQVSRLQIAEIVGSILLRPDVSENKVVEVVAETTAPLRLVEDMLGELPVVGLSQAERAEFLQRQAEADSSKKAQAQARRFSEEQEARQAEMKQREAERQEAAVARLQKELQIVKEREEQAKREQALATAQKEELGRKAAEIRAEAGRAVRAAREAKALEEAIRVAAQQGRVLSSEEKQAIIAGLSASAPSAVKEPPAKGLNPFASWGLFSAPPQFLVKSDTVSSEVESTTASKSAETAAKKEAQQRLLGEAEAKKKAESEANAKAEAEATAKLQAEAEAEAEAKAKVEAEAEAEAKVKAEGEAKAKARAEAEAKAKAEAEAKAKTEAEAAAKAKSEAEAAAKAKAKEEAEAAAKVKAQEEAKLREREMEEEAQVVQEKTQANEVKAFSGFKWPWLINADEEAPATVEKTMKAPGSSTDFPPSPTPLSPYAMYEDLKPPTSPTPRPPVSAKRDATAAPRTPPKGTLESTADDKKVAAPVEDAAAVRAKEEAATEAATAAAKAKVEEEKELQRKQEEEERRKQEEEIKRVAAQKAAEAEERARIALEKAKAATSFSWPWMKSDPKDKAADTSGDGSDQQEPQAAQEQEAASIEANSTSPPPSKTPLSPFVRYPDLKPPSSPTPSPPNGKSSKDSSAQTAPIATKATPVPAPPSDSVSQPAKAPAASKPTVTKRWVPTLDDKMDEGNDENRQQGQTEGVISGFRWPWQIDSSSTEETTSKTSSKSSSCDLPYSERPNSPYTMYPNLRPPSSPTPYPPVPPSKDAQSSEDDSGNGVLNLQPVQTVAASR